jgi:hypothetical protein
MVKYYHCEKCKKVYNTESWIGEVHTYNGICSECIKEEQKNHQEIVEDNIVENHGHIEKVEGADEKSTANIEIDKILLLNLEKKANEVLSTDGPINVLVKEIKDDLVGKAKQRIEETFQSFDAGKIDAQKTIDYAENILDYLSAYKDYMDKVVIKIENKPKMKVKTAIDKVLKESMANISKDISKDVLLNKKTILNTVSNMAVEWYNIYSDIKNALELTTKMVLHPFNEMQKKLGSLPFYNSS